MIDNIEKSVHSARVCEESGRYKQILVERNRLKTNLQNAIESGDGDAINSIQSQLSANQNLRFGAHVAELKTTIQNGTARLRELQDETIIIESERGRRNTELAAAIVVYEQKQLEVRKVDVALYSIDAEIENLRDSLRSQKKTLNDIVAQKLGEI